MASPFWSYFADKLHWPQAFAPGPLQAVVRGLAHHLDTTREDMPYLRQQFFPGLCADDFVPEHGLSRSLVRHPRETPEQFRQRVVDAYRWHLLGGKTSGLPQILQFYGFDIVRIENMGDSNPSRWAEFALELQIPTSDAGYADIVSTLDSLIWLVNEYKPARSRLFRIYTDEYDIRPIVLSEGPALSEGRLSFYSGVPVSGGDGSDDVLVSLGATRRMQAAAYLTSDADASFGIESRMGNLAPYLDRFVLGRSRLSDRLPCNNPFVIGALVSFLWAERQTVARSWRGEWDARSWLDYTGFDRRLPRWRMAHRNLSRSQLAPADSALSDTNSRLGATFATVIDNPPRLGVFRLSGHDCGRRDLRLHEMVIVIRGMAVLAVEPSSPRTSGGAWLASCAPIPDPERVRQAMLGEAALGLEPPAWSSPEMAAHHEFAVRTSSLEPGPAASALTTYQAPLWLGTWADADRTWRTTSQLSIQ